MQHIITNRIFSPMKREDGNLEGYFQCTIDDWINIDGIIIYKRGDEVSFRTPAKKLRAGGLIPYYQIRDKEAETQIIKAIKEEMQKAETERFFFASKED